LSNIRLYENLFQDIEGFDTQTIDLANGKHIQTAKPHLTDELYRQTDMTNH